MIVSKRVEVIPGCIRSVHVHPSGKARWVMHQNGKSKMVMGTVVDGKFLPSEKYVELVATYEPTRVSNKEENVISEFAAEIWQERRAEHIKKINRDNPKYVWYAGEERKVRWTSLNKGTGSISFLGKRLYGRVEGQNFVPNGTL